MQKPNPLDTMLGSVGYGFKCFTAYFGYIGGMGMLAGSIIFLGSPLGIVCLLMGGLMYALGRDLAKTLELEDKAGRDNDQDPDLPLGTV